MNVSIRQTLDLSSNLITNIENESFAALRQLRRLDLRANLMQELRITLPDGLEYIDVSENQLSTWPIYNLPAALHTLLVQNNQLQDLFTVAGEHHQQKWAAANKLAMLNASHNVIRDLPNGWHLPMLHTLDLSHNELVVMPANALTAAQMPELDTLILDANPMATIVFGAVTMIRRLSVNGIGELSELNGKSFENIGEFLNIRKTCAIVRRAFWIERLYSIFKRKFGKTKIPLN